MKNTAKQPINIVVYGAGSIGCYVGACLTQAGHHVTLVGRSRIRSDIQENGMHISDWKNHTFRLEPEEVVFSTDPSPIQHAQLIFVCVKIGDLAASAREIKQFISESAVVLSCQNGVSSAKILSQELPGHTILKGIVGFNVINKGRGHFHCGTEGDLIVDDHVLTQQLSETILLSGFVFKREKDLEALQWTKLIMNLNNAVNALSGKPLLEQLHDPNYRKVMAAVISEALNVLKKAGKKTRRMGNVVPSTLPFILRLPNWAFIRVASTMLTIDPQARSSMYEDLENRRTTEVDYLNGEISALAKCLGGQAKINERIVSLVKEAEDAGKGSPQLPAEALIC